MSKRGEWKQMADVIPDEVLHEVAVVAPLEDLAARIVSRYSDRLQRVGIYSMAGDAIFTEEEWATLAAEVKDLSNR